jgi:hypothetical protein
VHDIFLSAILQTTDVALREAKPQRMFVVGGGGFFY